MELTVRHTHKAQINDHLAVRHFNHSLHLEADGEIINLDYDPVKLYTILQIANGDRFDEQLHQEIIKVLQTYATLGRSTFKIVRHSNNIGQIFQKYHITDQINGIRHMAKAITIPRLILLFPHLLAKIVTIDMIADLNIPYESLEEIGLSNVSSACFWNSSFSLLPKHEAEAAVEEGRHKKIIKTMLLAQYEQQEIIHKDNKYRSEISPMERMDALIMTCKVIYNSDHIPGSIRWAAYQTFFLNDPLNGTEFRYNKAAEVFDDRFLELNPVLNSIFRLQKGSGIENGTNIREVLHVIRTFKEN